MTSGAFKHACATINSNASGSWSRREGERVQIVDVKPNGKATAVVLAGETKWRWVPTVWLDVRRPRLRRRPVRVKESML